MAATKYSTTPCHAQDLISPFGGFKKKLRALPPALSSNPILQIAVGYHRRLPMVRRCSVSILISMRYCCFDGGNHWSGLPTAARGLPTTGITMMAMAKKNFSSAISSRCVFNTHAQSRYFSAPRIHLM